jgi:carboxylesterase type B
MYREQAIHDVGAFHTAEIVYVFRNLNSRPWPWTDDDRKLSELMSIYWVNFAKKGDPNGPGLPKWPVADAKNSDRLLQFGPGAAPKIGNELDKPALDFFESVLAKAKRAD